MAQHAMRMFSLTRTQRYGIAVLGVAATVVLRLALDPLLKEDVPLFLFTIPVIIASWSGGLGPGLLATVLSLLAGNYLFMSPRGTIAFAGQINFLRGTTFAFLGIAFSLLFDKIRKVVRTEFECLENFGILIESLQEYAIITLDPAGRVSCWNQGAERIAGYKHKEVMGRDFSILYTPEDIESDKPRRDLETAIAKGRYAEERWQPRKDGSRFWANTVIAPLHDILGRHRGFAKITRDVTQRKLAEEALKGSRRFIQQIIDVSPGVICIYDVVQQKIVFVNRGLASTLGYPQTQETLHPDFFQTSMHPDDWHLFQAHLHQLAGASSEEIGEFQFRMRHSGGEWRWFHSRNKVFARNSDGTVREIIGTATDITERKSAEDRTRFLANLNEAFRALADVNEIMQIAVRMLGEHLNTNRCVYSEVDVAQGYFTNLTEYIHDTTPLKGRRYPLSVLRPDQLQAMRANRVYVCDDIEAEPPSGVDQSEYRRAQIRSLVIVPLNKGGHFIARMSVHQRTPRIWTSEEIELITTVANRCWESVERAAAIRRLEESEERYRAFIANSSEAIWRFELDKPIPVELPAAEQLEMVYEFAYLAECNDAMARMYGYDRTDQVLGKRIADLISRSDLESLQFFRALKGCGYRLTDVETRAVDRQGHMKYFLNNLLAIRDGYSGAIVRFWGTSRDITAQEEASQIIRESEERFRRITDATQDALWEVDLKTNHLWWSEGAARLFGRSPVELQIGLEDWYSGIHPEDVDRVKAKFDAFMEGPETEWTDEYRFRRADGKYVDIYDQGSKFFDNGVPRRVAGAMVDITEQKQASQALKESEEKFAKAFKASPDALVISRISDGRMIEVNESFAALSGYSVDELIGGSTITLDLYANTEDRKRALEIMKQQNRVRDFEFTMKRKSGERRLITFSAEPVQIRGEQCWLTIGHDITERKRIEEERDRLFRQEQAAREEAEAASRMKDDFLATISHELRTPLTSILGWSRLLSSGALSESQITHAHHVIEQSASAQARLVDDILDTSRIITGRLQLEAQPVDIKRVFQAAVEVVRPSADTKKISLSVTIGNPIGMVLGDANRLQQVIWNLLSNAVKFTNEGGRVDAQLTRIDDQVEIIVTDTGIGIDPQFLPYIFDRFRQADSTSTRRFGGLGLGLAIVRHVVEVHGGTVSASSPGRGQGSTFKVRFPVSAPAAAQVEPPPEQPKHVEELLEEGRQKLHGIRVLLVEDDADTLDMLRFILEQYGAEVFTAASTREGLKILDHWQPDALVSDLAMPGQDGYELIRQLRSRGAKRGGNIPAVALSAYTRSEDRQRALAAGFQTHVSKPVDPEELVNVVANLAGLIHS
jgi:PAS domain S-box-containing protein